MDIWIFIVYMSYGLAAYIRMPPPERPRLDRRAASAKLNASYRSRETAVETHIRLEKQRICQSQLRGRNTKSAAFRERFICYAVRSYFS